MSKDEKRVPEVRFKGFTEDWEQRKLGEILKVNSGRDYKHLKKGKVPVYGTGGYMLSVNDKLSDKNAIGIGRKGTIDKPQLLKAPFWTVDTLFYMTMEEQVNIWFCYTLTNKINWRKYDESTGVPSLSKNTINKIIINLPANKEQEKIGELFKQLDDTIALHQQKIDKLARMKQGFLQKKFPQKGENIPTLRFAYFKEEWEQRKLGEIATFSKGSGYTKKELAEVGNPIILYGRLYTKYETIIENVDTFALKTEKAILSKGNDVIVPASGETSEDISRASVVSKPGIILGGDLNIIQLNNKIDSVFLALTISNGEQQRELSRKAQGNSVVHLYNSNLKEVNVLYPHKEEQIKISELFKRLNNTITLHQMKLDKLQSLKKAYLQKMFI